MHDDDDWTCGARLPGCRVIYCDTCDPIFGLKFVDPIYDAYMRAYDDGGAEPYLFDVMDFTEY